MSFPVTKAASYVLVHAPDMIMHNGTTQTVERRVNPDSEYLKKLPAHIRTFDEVINYGPNQCYIGNMNPAELAALPEPWYQNPVNGKRDGRFGEIMPQDEFIAMMKLADAFELVVLDSSFVSGVKTKMGSNPVFAVSDIDKIGPGEALGKISELIDKHGAQALFHNSRLVGCVKKAHDVDVNLGAHVMFENLVVKASGALALKHLIAKNGIEPLSIDYVIECSEEACGDMNQRGGGNFAKAVAEMAGIENATGSDLRSFCAAPTHALISAAALVKSGVYENVAIVAGGSSAKLGMNGKDHVKKDLPILEDVIGGFAVLVSKNDGFNPVLRTDLVGRHNVGTGSSPQAVITALIAKPLDKAGLKVSDIDKYSVEMQNPDVTKPAGAGDVPNGNYKMIAAIGVKRGELERTGIDAFVKEHGMPGWAPTQGHIPSGVPYIGFALDDLCKGKLNRTMIVGKGSLFLGRMTNLFDGVSIIMERNPGKEEEPAALDKSELNKLIAEAMKGLAAQLLGEQGLG
ncbi:glycine/sarcosine/betaine reductase complex component C subunit beta [Spirochaetota bacterium]